ncbi:hypothetical protein DPMN_129449 [Dreissena polymorpha]|uniref:Uncharacterized protein n=1 Tax=Dreissena polymorpha TaxID=45954 RepID=A0A9D4H2N7_DREPO|nr:hypothetical protein DPMN_129449 [Dreissena polymorpha]
MDASSSVAVPTDSSFESQVGLPKYGSNNSGGAFCGIPRDSQLLPWQGRTPLALSECRLVLFCNEDLFRDRKTPIELCVDSSK